MARGGKPGGGGRAGRGRDREAGGSRAGGDRPGGGPAARGRQSGSAPGRGSADGPGAADGSMVVYGRNAVRELIRGPRTVHKVWATSAAARAEPWLAPLDPQPATDEELAEVAHTHDHQGVAAEAAPYRYAEPHTLLEPENALIVALDEVQDPRNLGAVARVAECVGASGLVIGERRAAQVTPVVCKASAGAVEHLPIARARNLADFLDDAKQKGAWVYGAASTDEAVPYDQPDYRGRTVIVFGSEGRGLRPRVRNHCDQLIALPLKGRVESLNVSAAASAVLYGILQFRGHLVDSAP